MGFGPLNYGCLMGFYMAIGQKPWHLVNPKIAGKWMFIPLELIIIGFDPPPYEAVGYTVNVDRVDSFQEVTSMIFMDLWGT